MLFRNLRIQIFRANDFFRSVFELIMLLLKQTKKDLTFSIFHILKLSAGQYFTTTWDGRTVYSSRNVILKVRNINEHAFLTQILTLNCTEYVLLEFDQI